MYTKDTISTKRKLQCVVLDIFTYLSVLVMVLILVGLIGCILYRGLPYVTIELLTQKPSLINDTIGILPNLLNTVYVILITLVVVLPLGVGTAIYLNEYAKSKKAVRLIELATETLSGIPSIVYGLVGNKTVTKNIDKHKQICTCVYF